MDNENILLGGGSNVGNDLLLFSNFQNNKLCNIIYIYIYTPIKKSNDTY